MAAWLSNSAVAAREFVLAHRRGLSTSMLVSLAGFGVAAFGIAPLAPDAAELPHRLISEAVTLSALEGQLEALAVHTMTLSRTTTTAAASKPKPRASVDTSSRMEKRCQRAI